MKRFNVWMGGALVCAALATSASPAASQTPEGLLKEESATTGSTDVAHHGFEQTAAKTTDTKEATEMKLSAGGLLATGNSRSMAFTGSGELRIRRAENQYFATIAANYARAAATPADSMETSVENVQARIRYDRFLSSEWALFLAESARKDRFQGLDLRLNFDPGVAYYLLDVEKHRLWAELGYDLQYDIRDEDAIIAAAAEGTTVEKTTTRHSGRAFVGYENNLNEAVRFNTGVEYIQAIVNTENWRLNWNVGLTSALSNAFSLATTFNLRYDNNPLPGVENTDTITAVSLVYQLL